MIAPDDADQFVVLQTVVGTLGFLGSLFLVLTWGLFPQKRKQHLTFWFSVCSLVNSLCVIIGLGATGGDLDELLCKDGIQPNTQSDGISLCVVLSALFIFFGTGQCVWWGFTAVDLYRKIVLGKRNTMREKKTQHIIAWSLCSLVLIAAIAIGILGNQQGTPFCLFALTPGTPKLDQNEILIEIGVFYGLIFFITIVGTFCMLSVIFIIIRQLRQLKVLQQVTGRSAIRQYNMYRTPFVFVVIFLFVWMTIFTHRIVLLLEIETYDAEGVGWVTCFVASVANGIAQPAEDPAALTQFLINADPDQVGCGFRQPGGVPKAMFIMLQLVVLGQGVGCGFRQPGGVPKAMFIMLQLVVLGQGIFSFLIFGLKSENFWLWRNVYANCSARNIFTMGYTSKGSKASKADGPTASYSTNTVNPTMAPVGVPRYYQPQEDPRYPSPPSLYTAPTAPSSRGGARGYETQNRGQGGRKPYVYMPNNSPDRYGGGGGGSSTFGRSGYSNNTFRTGSSYSSGPGMRGG
eukprot:CAMPEP_0184559396 /NCGR_PEP_ID=MMETSP0199_2-20130426/46407_1 /TAXON_ID=1112570 /ORGANISM="Thraustochytrium sp., Strain LLF1b" /LENGTH=516 /DNA_ID=CAMNT_0026956683 /DNA_START=295 /DNA_END=1842 /DNA_ORIENTATION=-